MRRNWIRVPLSAVAGYVALLACFGAVNAISRYEYQLAIYRLPTDYPRALDPPGSETLELVTMCTIILACASFTLPPLALGARLGRALLTSMLCSFCFGAFVVLYYSLLNSALNPLVVYPLTLMALVGTSAVGSLVAVQGEGRMAARILPATLIAALTIYCASLFTVWSTVVLGDGWPDLEYLEWPTLPIPIRVAAFSWPILPGIVAWLRSA